MTTKKLSELDSLLDDNAAKKAAAKPQTASELLDSILAGRELTTTKKRKLLSELDALLGDIEAEETDEKYVDVLIELAPCQGLGLMHAGQMYLHGGRYTVPEGVARDLGEMSRRGNSHEAAITKQETAGRRRRNLDANTPVMVRNPVTGGMQVF